MIDAAAEWRLTGDGEDSTAGWLAMHDDMRAQPDRTWNIQLPRGHILTGAPLSFPARRVKLVGEDTTLQHASKGLFSASEPFRDITFDGTYPTRSTWYPGHRIAAAPKSATKLTLLDDTAGLAPGPALLAGRNQQFQNAPVSRPGELDANGYPFNARWFEWVEIADITDGIVTVRRPLRFAYETGAKGWEDYPHPAGGGMMVGAPRLWSCNRPTWRIPDRIELEGINFLRPPGASATDPGAGNVSFALPCRLLIVRDCVFECSTFVQMCEEARFIDCHLRAAGPTTGSVEIDKLSTRVEFSGGSVMGEISSRGGGCMEVAIDGTQVTGHDRPDGSHVLGVIAINVRESIYISRATYCESFAMSQTHGGYFREGGLSMSVDARRV